MTTLLIIYKCTFVMYSRSDGDTKAAEATKRKLSADLALTRAHIQLKRREGK